MTIVTKTVTVSIIVPDHIQEPSTEDVQTFLNNVLEPLWLLDVEEQEQFSDEEPESWFVNDVEVWR